MNKNSQDVLDILLNRRFIVVKLQKLRSTKQYRYTNMTERLTWNDAFEEYTRLLNIDHSPKTSYTIRDDLIKNTVVPLY